MKKEIVVIGGGTGSYTVLTGLKEIENINITAIVASTDSGGSTGRLRDEFGRLPVGDLRQCLIALAENSEEQKLLRELFAYRFDKGGSGLEGHNFGNLFMTALRDIVDDELESIEYVEKLFNIKGKVYPVTLEDTQLVAKYENGKTLVGESEIDEPKYPHDGRLHITELYTSPKVQSHNAVIKSLENADFIIIGPGDIYTSLLAAIVINNMSEHIKNSKAKIVYIGNLFTKFGQTYKYRLSDFVSEIEKYCKRKVDFILFNNSKYPKEILEKYLNENSEPVENNLLKDIRVISENLLAEEEIKSKKGDVLKRSLIRHDSQKIRKVIEKIIFSS